MKGRFDYVKYDEQAISQQAFYKGEFEKIALVIESLESGRAKSLALTAIEECYMWIGKALRDEQILRNDETELQEERTNS